MNGDGFQEIAISAQAITPPGNPSKIVMVSLKPPGVSAFGGGCPADSGLIPRIGAHPFAIPGGAINFHVSNTAIGRCAGLALGVSNTSYGAIALPWFPFPASGPLCSLLVSLDMFANGRTHTASNQMGAASYTLDIPALSSLSGATFYAQWAVDNAIGWVPPLAMTRGLQITIQ